MTTCRHPGAGPQARPLDHGRRNLCPLYFPAAARASFLDVMEADDKIMFVNSFSKNWSMTGWRVGWIVAPPQTGQVLENLIQYSTSGVAQFMQKGAVAALNEGDAFVQANIDKATRSRDILCDALIATNRVETLKPDGALYAFLKIDGVTDSRKAAIDIVDKTGVGLAPGTAFGPGDLFRTVPARLFPARPGLSLQLRRSAGMPD
jgi:aspartate/methionine/tyrosine aminotransferase